VIGTVDNAAHIFREMAGADEAKPDLQEIVDFRKEPERFRTLGAHIRLTLSNTLTDDSRAYICPFQENL